MDLKLIEELDGVGIGAMIAVLVWVARLLQKVESNIESVLEKITKIEKG